MTVTRLDLYRLSRNPPPRWGMLFGPVPGRSNRIRCLLCGRDGHWGAYGPNPWQPPAPWQLRCLAGHHSRCDVCKRPFVNGTALAGHQTCKLHHACCRDHTTVPAWKNPFTAVLRVR